MDIEVKAWLFDILKAIGEIDSFFEDRPMDFHHYQADIRTKRAVERNIEIIGEAMNRILQKDDSIAISGSRKIVDLRNRVIHGYDSVSDATIWSVVSRHLPKLKVEVEDLLNAH
jgi:uncharacterized protein with HEPN domain